MINHTYSDGSVGHEFEKGDRVISTIDEYIMREPKKALGYKGQEATVQYVEYYNPQCPSYHTAFVSVVFDNGKVIRSLMCHFEPASSCQTRKNIDIP